MRSHASTSDGNRSVRKRVGDELLRTERGRASLRREDQTVREHRRSDGFHVVGSDVLAAVGERTGLRHPEQRDPGARARTEIEA